MLCVTSKDPPCGSRFTFPDHLSFTTVTAFSSQVIAGGHSIVEPKRHFVERAPRCLERYRNVVEEVSRFLGASIGVAICQRDDKLSAFLADFLQPKIAVLQQPGGVAR